MPSVTIFLSSMLVLIMSLNVHLDRLFYKYSPGLAILDIVNVDLISMPIVIVHFGDNVKYPPTFNNV